VIDYFSKTRTAGFCLAVKQLLPYTATTLKARHRVLQNDSLLLRNIPSLNTSPNVRPILPSPGRQTLGTSLALTNSEM